MFSVNVAPGWGLFLESQRSPRRAALGSRATKTIVIKINAPTEPGQHPAQGPAASAGAGLERGARRAGSARSPRDACAAMARVQGSAPRRVSVFPVLRSVPALREKALSGAASDSPRRRATATLSQELPVWLDCHVRMYEYFEGVSALTICDNLRSGSHIRTDTRRRSTLHTATLLPIQVPAYFQHVSGSPGTRERSKPLCWFISVGFWQLCDTADSITWMR